MNRLAVWLLVVLIGAGAGARAQTAGEMQSGSPVGRPGETSEQHARRLVDEMVKALGGDAWLNKKTMYVEGDSAPFFQGQPSGGVSRFVEWKEFGAGNSPELARIEFVTYRGLVTPGTTRQVAHIWTADNGYEWTFKGQTTLPEKQVTDYMRRRAHTLEELVHHWINAPGTIMIYEGAGMRDRRPVDKITVLRADNDAITLELEQDTHLPLQRAFQWRNEQFKDHDLDEEVFGDWKYFDGIATPMNMTTYRNGDISGQTFYKKVKYGVTVAADLFDKNTGIKNPHSSLSN